MTSIVYRGTPEAPGLVLALDRDAGGRLRRASPTGCPARAAAATLAYLRERELVSYAYDEARLPVELDGRSPSSRRWPTSRTRSTRSTAAG